MQYSRIPKDTYEVQKSRFSSVRPQYWTGKRSFKAREVHRVNNFFDQPEAHIRHAVDVVQLSHGTVWLIFRKQLNWKAYEPHLVQQHRWDKSDKNGCTHQEKSRAMLISTRWPIRANVQTYRFGIFTPFHKIVTYKFVRNICFSITSDGSYWNCISDWETTVQRWFVACKCEDIKYRTHFAGSLRRCSTTTLCTQGAWLPSLDHCCNEWHSYYTWMRVALRWY